MPRLLSLALAALAAAAPLAAQSRTVPTPESVLGFTPGADRRLPTWKQVTTYFQALDRASPRVSVRVLGKTTLGRPFLVAFIADSATLAHLDRYREIQQKLLDPRLRKPGERARLVGEGKNVILITSSIHSTEVGGFLTPFQLAYRLARADTPEARSILANTIVMLVPSQNPDGVDIVGDWYRATLGTPAEGTGPPELYHHYTGHDNNRDWYAFTQPETRYVIDSLYGRWTPEIVNDIHQQGSNAGRIFIPPYMDPVEPNIDPILTGATNALGMAMAWRMLADGKTGIATNASYDEWTPARQYSLNHHGVRILTETASARLASPLEVPFDKLGPGRGYDARVSSWNYPALWPGGTWTLGDIVDYQTSASWALLVEAARDRSAWLESYATLGDRALDPSHPWRDGEVAAAYLIPKRQADAQALQRLIWTLQHGQVEVHEARVPVTVGDVTYPAGSYLVPIRQPFGSYANALLERQHYPNLREYPGGPPKAPYDVTAHTLPLLFGVDVAATASQPAAGPVLARVPEPRFTVPGLSDGAGPRIAIYKSYQASMDEGWTRWVFDVNRIGYTSVVDREVRAGGLRDRFDVIIVPDQRPQSIANGVRGSYPDSLQGGLGDEGAKALRAFVEQGGTALFFNDASDYAIEALELPIQNVLSGLARTAFYAPGSILGVELDRSTPIGSAYTAPVPAVWFESGPAFDVTDQSRVSVVARYPSGGDPLLSGWLLGGEKLAGKAALVDVTLGQGHAILYGFRPQYRGQSMATQPLMWAAIRGGR